MNYLRFENNQMKHISILFIIQLIDSLEGRIIFRGKHFNKQSIKKCFQRKRCSIDVILNNNANKNIAESKKIHYSEKKRTR